MVSIGQVYELPFSKNPVVVTHIKCNKENNKDKKYDWIYLITDEGLIERLWRVSVEETMKLLAEYPSWQVAVNSTEFRGVK